MWKTNRDGGRPLGGGGGGGGHYRGGVGGGGGPPHRTVGPSLSSDEEEGELVDDPGSSALEAGGGAGGKGPPPRGGGADRHGLGGGAGGGVGGKPFVRTSSLGKLGGAGEGGGGGPGGDKVGGVASEPPPSLLDRKDGGGGGSSSVGSSERDHARERDREWDLPMGGGRRGRPMPPPRWVDRDRDHPRDFRDRDRDRDWDHRDRDPWDHRDRDRDRRDWDRDRDRDREWDPRDDPFAGSGRGGDRELAGGGGKVHPAVRDRLLDGRDLHSRWDKPKPKPQQPKAGGQGQGQPAATKAGQQPPAGAGKGRRKGGGGGGGGGTTDLSAYGPAAGVAAAASSSSAGGLGPSKPGAAPGPGGGPPGAPPSCVGGKKPRSVSLSAPALSAPLSKARRTASYGAPGAGGGDRGERDRLNRNRNDPLSAYGPAAGRDRESKDGSSAKDAPLLPRFRPAGEWDKKKSSQQQPQPQQQKQQQKQHVETEGRNKRDRSASAVLTPASDHHPPGVGRSTGPGPGPGRGGKHHLHQQTPDLASSSSSVAVGGAGKPVTARPAAETTQTPVKSRQPEGDERRAPKEPQQPAAAAPSSSSAAASGGVTSRSPLTCASLGPEDKVVRAERAVQKLSELVDKSGMNRPKEGKSLALPSKEQIVRGISDLESQIKDRRKEKDSIKAAIKKAEQEEESVRLQALEVERKRKLERERQEAERRMREAKIKHEEDERERERRRALEMERERENRNKLRLEKERKQREEQLEKLRKEDELLELEEKEQEQAAEKLMETTRKRLLLARARAENAATEATAKKKLADEEAAAEATRKVGAVSSAVGAAETSDDAGGVSSQDGGNMTQLGFPTIDRPDEMQSLVSSITEENRRRAKRAQLDSFFALPYTPPPESGGSHVRANTDAADVDDDDHAAIQVLSTNAEWVNLARRVTGPQDALYTDPSESPFFDYHTRRHEVIGYAILENVRKRKKVLQNHWEEVAKEYAVKQKLFMDERKAKGNDTGASAGSDNDPWGKKQAIDERLFGMSGISASGRGGSYRRPRRAVGASFSPFSSIGGDVVRSEYEQEQIIKHITEKENMEKRIKFGGCALPRQICELEKDMFVTYRDTQRTRLVLDPLKEEREQKTLNIWSDVEKCIFLDRFLQYPKDFRKIASFLRNKSTADCVAFYYLSKKTVPYKAALREHLMRKKRRPDVSWKATVQSALAVGAKVTEGTGDDRPFTFSLPEDDNTFFTHKFHPMQRELFDAINDDSDEMEVTLDSDDRNKRKASGYLFSLDDPKLMNSSLLHRTISQDSLSGSKRKVGASEDTESHTDSSNKKVTKTNVSGNIHDTNKHNSADQGGAGGGTAGVRKPPQKWSQMEKKLFFDAVEKHGKNWAMLEAAVGTKSLSQIKNYFYDHKKQFSKQPQRCVQDSQKSNETKLSNEIDAPILHDVESAHEPNIKYDEMAGDIASARLIQSASSSPHPIATARDSAQQNIATGSDHSYQVAENVNSVLAGQEEAWLSAGEQGVPMQVEQQESVSHVAPSPSMVAAPHNGMLNSHSSQSHQQLIASIQNVIPWVSAAQVAQVAAMQQHQQRHNDANSATTSRIGVRDNAWLVDASLNSLAYSLGHHTSTNPSRNQENHQHLTMSQHSVATQPERLNPSLGSFPHAAALSAVHAGGAPPMAGRGSEMTNDRRTSSHGVSETEPDSANMALMANRPQQVVPLSAASQGMSMGSSSGHISPSQMFSANGAAKDRTSRVMHPSSTEGSDLNNGIPTTGRSDQEQIPRAGGSHTN